MKCPRCIENMEPVDITGHEAWSCIYCHGHWVELKTLENISRELSPGQEQAAPIQLRELNPHAEGDRVCPTCPGINLHVLKADGLELDICKGCKGLFFDDGELEQVVGEIPEKEGISPLGWVLVAVVARAAFLGGGSA